MRKSSGSGDGNNNEGEQGGSFVSVSGTTWLKPSLSPSKCRFEPHRFLRTHHPDKRSNTPKIWDVAFEPGKSDVVATCGGKFICVFNLESGDLLCQYQHEEDQQFYCLSWSSLPSGNILASGSDMGEIRLYDIDRDVTFYSWSYKKATPINAAKFHSEEASWLITASQDGRICLWDIGVPAPPYRGVKHSSLLMLDYKDNLSRDIYSMAWVSASPGSGWIMIGAQAGLMGWQISTASVKELKFPPTSPKMVELRLQGAPLDRPYVDSVCSLGDNLVAVKCVNHGKIIVFKADFPDLGEEAVLEVQNLVEFPWRMTGEFYMNIGGLSSLHLLACGDDKGYIWVFQLPSWVTDTSDSCKKPPLPQKVAPLRLFPWPRMLEMEDGSREEHTGVMINKVAISPTGQYIVGVTDQNIVAVWRK